MKRNDIINLSKEEFIKELNRTGSRIQNNAGMWTIEWLTEHGSRRLASKVYRETREWQVENDELESGTVAQELQKGYMYKDSVVRHSMVSVVQ